MKWYWTPKGWLITIVAVGLLAGAAFTDVSGMNDILSNILLGLGLLTAIYGYIRTIKNVRRKRGKG